MEGEKSVQQKQDMPSVGCGEGARFVQAGCQADRLIDFAFYAPQAYSVNVAGSFNNWTPGAFPLKKDSFGTWRGSIRLKPGNYQYRFFMDRRWVDDPNAKKTAANEFGSHNAVLEVV